MQTLPPLGESGEPAPAKAGGASPMGDVNVERAPVGDASLTGRRAAFPRKRGKG